MAEQRRRGGGSLAVAMAQLQEMLSGASLRAIAAVPQLGEIVSAFVGDGSGAGIDVEENKRDVWVSFTDVLSGLAGVGRLFVPAGILFRAPAAGDGAHVVRGRKMRGPGAAVVMADGGNGSDSIVPDWFPDDAGLYEPTKKLHVEASNDEVRVTGKTATVEATDGNTDLTGQVVTINGTDYWLLKTDTFLADFATNWNLLLSVLGAGTTGSPAAQTLVALAAALSQLEAFGTNLGGATYKSTKAQNG